MSEREHSGIGGGARRWAAVALTALVLIVAFLCLGEGFLCVGRPVPGFLVAGNRVVSALSLGNTRQGDGARLRNAQLVGIDGVPVTDAAEVELRLEELVPGTSVAYRFRAGAEVFSSVVPVTDFRVSNWAVLYGTFFVLALCFALSGLWAVHSGPLPPVATGFFWLCETAALCFATGGDWYGPYRFASVHLIARCLLPAAALHFAAGYPEPLSQRPAGRRWVLALLYLGCGLTGVLVLRVADDPSLYKPFFSFIHLLLANAYLLLVARLGIALTAGADVNARRGHRVMLGGACTLLLTPGVLAVGAARGGNAVSPALGLFPLALFPLLAASVVRHSTAPILRAQSTLHRLSVLFFDAVESTFLIAVAAFTFSQSWSELSHDFVLAQRRQDRIEFFRAASLAEALPRLAAIDALVESPREYGLVLRARTAIAGRDWEAARRAIGELAQEGENTLRKLEARREWSGYVAATLVVASLLVGIVQTVRFARAVRRWLIEPIHRLREATLAIGSGDLGYRVALAGEEELASLAQSVNAMAASLREIQRRIEDERAAREEAAGAARDAERRRVGRELHDGVLQDLAAVKLLLEAELKRPSEKGLRAAIDALVAVITQTHRVVDDLRQPDLASFSLADAISEYARAHAHGRDVVVTTDLRDEGAVPDWASRDVYRICQEAIANAIRHASPRELRIGLCREQGAVVLEIADDGSGFDPEKVHLGTGILGMRERAAALGGDLTIVSRAGAGTTVRLTLPHRRPVGRGNNE